MIYFTGLHYTKFSLAMTNTTYVYLRIDRLLEHPFSGFLILLKIFVLAVFPFHINNVF